MPFIITDSGGRRIVGMDEFDTFEGATKMRKWFHDHVDDKITLEIEELPPSPDHSDLNRDPARSLRETKTARDAHRAEFSDIEWARQQPRGKPNYFIGDVIEFNVGGFGVIAEVSRPHGGWPASYSTESVEGMEYHSEGKIAWHYELDFKRLVEGGAVRTLSKKGVIHNEEWPSNVTEVKKNEG